MTIRLALEVLAMGVGCVIIGVLIGTHPRWPPSVKKLLGALVGALIALMWVLLRYLPAVHP